MIQIQANSPPPQQVIDSDLSAFSPPFSPLSKDRETICRRPVHRFPALKFVFSRFYQSVD